ncbi:MAG TPA: penicillin acylase family protein [Lacunisphaera sp.]|nr:penicillin acylase family protein [Lacunisphaera sp.]
MTASLHPRARLALRILGGLLLLAVVALGVGWWRLRGSLPPLDGTLALAGLSAPTRIERDAQGVPTVTGATRADVARATGFLHAQDRFFEMDLLRRRGAGELAELFGAAAVPLDRIYRRHGFRRLAEKSLALLPPEKRALLDAYTAGVNAGLAALRQKPWEYLALRTTPQPWRAEDSILVVHAMWFDLQDATGQFELSLGILRQALGQGVADFLAPRGTSWDSALDGSTFPPVPLPPVQITAPAGSAAISNGVTAEAFFPGSNSFAIAGSHTTSGAAMLANDMHLTFGVPAIWYRAVLAWTDAAGAARRLVGVTLPGAPALVAGSNGHIAWGFTASNVDTIDIITLETTEDLFYRTPDGSKEIEDRPDPIKVRGGDPVPFVTRWTEWGPIIASLGPDRHYALRWTAHDPAATNFEVLDLETATTAAEAVAIGHRAGMPNQNLMVADQSGSIAWTVTGKIPRRVGYDGRFPTTWGYGDRRWDGWLNPDEIPVIMNPPDGFLWSANERLVGGEAYRKLGDFGYDDGPRGRQIRDDLRDLVASGKKAAPTDLLAIQLDDRALFLERWQKFLLETLTDAAVADRKARGELRDAVRTWNGRASIDSTAYRFVRDWRLRVAERAFAPFLARARETYPEFSHTVFQYEDALWQLTHEKPARLLGSSYASWDALLLAAADDVLAEADKAGVPPARFTWGSYNTLHMRHPISRFLPGWLARCINMPADALPGGADMPRVQSPTAGASERLAVAPGHESEGLFHQPGGASGHPLSPYYRAGHDAWAKGEPTPLLPGPAQHMLQLQPK